MNEKTEVDGPANPSDPGAGANPGGRPPADKDAERSTAAADREKSPADARPGFTTETGTDKLVE